MFARAAIDAIYYGGLEWPTKIVQSAWLDMPTASHPVPEWEAMWRASPLAPEKLEDK